LFIFGFFVYIGAFVHIFVNSLVNRIKTFDRDGPAARPACVVAS
jgi:hypothetical protein